MMRVIVFAAGLAVAAPAVDAAVIVANGGFDELDARGLTLGDSDGQLLSELHGTGNTSWDVYGELPGGWKGVANADGDFAGIEIQTDGTARGVPAHSGSFYVELDTESEGGSNSNSVMEQALGTLENGRYELRFWYRPRTQDPDSNGITAEIYNGIQLMEEVVSSDTSSWQEQVFEFFVPQGTGDLTLRFSAGGTADEYGGFIDTVSIAAVPLPTAGFVLLTALGGAAAAYRRRKG